RPGQRLVIPRYNTAAAGAMPAPVVHPVATAPARPATTVAYTPGVHIVAPGETLSKIAHRYGKSIPEIGKANNIEPHATLKSGERIIIPGGSGRMVSASRARTAQAQPLAQAPKVQPAAKTQLAVKQVEQTQPVQQAAVITQTNDTPAPTTASAKAAD